MMFSDSELWKKNSLDVVSYGECLLFLAVNKGGECACDGLFEGLQMQRQTNQAQRRRYHVHLYVTGLMGIADDP